MNGESVDLLTWQKIKCVSCKLSLIICFQTLLFYMVVWQHMQGIDVKKRSNKNKKTFKKRDKNLKKTFVNVIKNVTSS